MPRVLLVHWKEPEVAKRLARLKSAGFDARAMASKASARSAAAPAPPAAHVIDLSRLPSHGKAVALALRQSKKTRHIPLVFVGGEPDKVAGIKSLFPDATYASWRGIKTALNRAIAQPVAEPVVPKSESGPYSGTPLPRKLGLKAGTRVVLFSPPKGFARRLDPLPANATVRQNLRGAWDLAVCFFTTLDELDRQLDGLVQAIGDGALWIAWPKKSSGVSSDLSDKLVRKLALAAGLVDYKVCAIDDVWSGLKFARQKKR
jgi:hypothetical protein